LLFASRCFFFSSFSVFLFFRFRLFFLPFGVFFASRWFCFRPSCFLGTCSVCVVARYPRSCSFCTGSCACVVMAFRCSGARSSLPMRALLLSRVSLLAHPLFFCLAYSCGAVNVLLADGSFPRPQIRRRTASRLNSAKEGGRGGGRVAAAWHGAFGGRLGAPTRPFADGLGLRPTASQ